MKIQSKEKVEIKSTGASRSQGFESLCIYWAALLQVRWTLQAAKISTCKIPAGITDLSAGIH